jgi:ferredoxin-nitrite reductase
MARLRIPAGQVQSYQLREIAEAAQKLTTGYIQITTRANFQVRIIQPQDAPEFLRRIQRVGLHTRGSGADNVRNLTANPTAGIDPYELIDVGPYCHEMAQIIISTREFYDLPRKFNIAFDGGGLIGSVEDTNDIGAKAVHVIHPEAGLAPGIYFRIKLGGATGHQAFARDLGVLVSPEKLVRVVTALLRVYVKNGNRSDRKKARLKHLLETWSLDQYLTETEKVLGFTLFRAPLDAQGRSPLQAAESTLEIPHSHVGAFAQKQPGLHYLGASVPVGQMTPKQLLRLAEIADLYGSGEIRLTVWQNFIIPNIPEAYLATARKALEKLGFPCTQSHLRSGLIACTGNRYCKFSSSDTKGHALALAHYLDKRIQLDQPVNIHFTGCPHSCAQHYMGDIGLLGTKVKRAGESVEGYHVFVGGGFGSHQAVGRQVFTGVAHDELNSLLENMLKVFLKTRQLNETFQAFTQRHDLNSLQTLFTPAG